MRLRMVGCGLALLLGAGIVDAGDGAWPRFEAGVKAYRAGDFRVAQVRFESVVQADPNFGDAYYYLGVLAERRGDRKAAVSLYKDVKKKWPTFALSQERLGQIALQLNDPKSAEHYFTVVAEVAPGVNAWMQLGGVQIDLKKYKEAEKSLGEGLKLSKGNLSLIELQARLFSETDRHEQAYDCYSKILKVMPKDSTSRYLRALCLVEMKRPRKATQEMELLLKSDPYHSGAIRHLLAVYESDPGKADEIQVLNKRLELLRKNPPKVRHVKGTKKSEDK